MRRLLGIELDAARVRELLEPLEFTVAGDGDELTVEVPSHRLDVVVAADVAEEIARAHGYERIAGRLPQAALPPYRPDPSEPRSVVRRILAGLGLEEVIGHALIGPEDLQRAGLDPSDPELVRLFNPLSPQHSILRPSMAPSMLGGLAENARRRRTDAWLFDLGKVYRHPAQPSPRDRASETAGTGRYESWELGIALSGSAAPAAPGEEPLVADVATIKGIVDALHDGLGAPRPGYRAEPAGQHHPHRHPGRTALITDAAGPRVWVAGRGPPARRRGLGPDRAPGRRGDRPRPAAGAQPGRRPRRARAGGPAGRSRPGRRRRRRDAGGGGAAHRAHLGRTAARDVRLFDVYRGDQIGPGRVSYALAFRFQPLEAGDEAEIDRALNKVRGSLDGTISGRRSR